jgi:hypothetical protein
MERPPQAYAELPVSSEGENSDELIGEGKVLSFNDVLKSKLGAGGSQISTGGVNVEVPKYVLSEESEQS